MKNVDLGQGLEKIPLLWGTQTLVVTAKNEDKNQSKTTFFWPTVLTIYNSEIKGK